MSGKNSKRSEKKKKAFCYAAGVLICVLLLGSAGKVSKAMELGGFDLNVGVGEQWEVPENFFSEMEEPAQEAIQEPAQMQESSVEEDLMRELQEAEPQPAYTWEEIPVSEWEELTASAAAPSSAPAADQTAAPSPAPAADQTAAPDTTSAPSSTPTPDPTSAPSSTPMPDPTSTPSPTPTSDTTSASSPTSTPDPTPTPGSTPVPSPTSTPDPSAARIRSRATVVHKTYTRSGRIPQIRVQCEDVVQIFSLRVNGRECDWRWEGSLLKIVAREKRGENMLEITLVSPAGKKMEISQEDGEKSCS